MDEVSAADWITKNKAIGMVTIIILTAALYIAFDVNYEECEDRNNCLVIAFEVQEAYLIWDKNHNIWQIRWNLSQEWMLKYILLPIL